MDAVDPEPSAELEAAYSADPEIVWVDKTSPEWIRTSIYWRAKVFQREFGYDVPQWEIQGRYDPEALGYVFHDDDFRIIGAACFRPLKNSSARFILDWIWLSPKARRNGFVSRQWEEFRRRFGLFLIGGPVSESMLTLLRLRFSGHNITQGGMAEPVIPMEQFASVQETR
ncbi:hypothetical protein [Roseovarius tolerans]|uniref:hypothetical protein n=1 Tax=Roseovarius tolerans TaxID=74031 RepID=UPI0011137F66|nr:hypothetical protein [Roseovarius tolerans]